MLILSSGLYHRNWEGALRSAHAIAADGEHMMGMPDALPADGGHMMGMPDALAADGGHMMGI